MRVAAGEGVRQVRPAAVGTAKFCPSAASTGLSAAMPLTRRFEL
jgi:hypothetical protein